MTIHKVGNKSGKAFRRGLGADRSIIVPSGDIIQTSQTSKLRRGLGRNAQPSSSASFSPLDLTNLHFYVEADKSAKYYDNTSKLLLSDLSTTKCAIKLSGNQPTYITNQLNGKGIIRFSNPSANNGQYLGFDSFATGTNGSTIFGVIKFNSSSIEQPIFSQQPIGGQETSGGVTLAVINGYTTWIDSFVFVSNTGTGSRVIAYENNTKANGQWYYLIASYSDSNAYLEVNGTPLTLSFIGANSGATINASIPATIGAYAGNQSYTQTDFDLACLGYCNSVLSASDRDKVRDYMQNTWNL